MPGGLRFRPHPPEDAVATRALVLLPVLIAVAAVGAQEEFTAQAILAGGAITAGFAVSHLLRRRRRWLLKAAITAAILIVARDFFAALLANPYDPRVPLVRLFLWLQALHSFDLPARKDLKYALASAVVLMAVAAVYARDTAFGLLLLPFALTAAAATAVMSAASQGGRRPGPAAAAGLAAGAAAVLLGGLVFAAVPRSEGLRVRWLPVSPQLSLATRLHARIMNPAYPPDAVSDDPRQGPPRFNPEGYIGFSAHVDLRIRGRLTDGVVMRVRATRPAFWRGLAFDDYTGVGWRMRDKAVEEYESDQPRIVPRFGPDEPWPAGSEQVIQTFYIEAAQPNVFFAAYRPFELYVPTAHLGVDRYAGLRSPVSLEPGTIYSVISRVPAPGARTLRSSRPVPEAIAARYLALPPLPPRVLELARAITAEAPTLYDKARAVHRYLTAYTYTLQAPPLPEGRDAVDHFLFESRQGSCEIFASAMAVLLRAAGVPTRLVTGYTPGTYNLFTGYHEVRNSDAHAWVEVFVPGAGWIEFEPTPGFPAPQAAGDRSARWLLRDGAVWVWRVGLEGLRTVVQAEPPPPAALLAALVAATGLAILYRTGRGGAPRRPAGGGSGPAEQAYARMLAMLARRGYARIPSVTPREYLQTLPPPLQQPAGTVTSLFEASRYGGRAAQADELRACAAALRTLRAAAARRP